MNPLFPELPEDVASLSEAEINAAIEERLAIVKKVQKRDPELLDGRDTQGVVAELQAGVESIKGLRAELQERERIEAEADAAIEALSAEASGTTDADEDEGEAVAPAEDEETEEVGETEPVAVAAAARPIRTRRREIAPEKRDDAKQPMSAMVAASSFNGIQHSIREGEHFTSKMQLAEALVEKRKRLSGTPDGHEDKVVVASIRTSFPEDRILKPGEFNENWEKIQSVVGEDALVASGGLCAPVTPYYDLELVATTARPVRDSLPVFNAQRGGIRYAPPPGLSTITTGVGYLTAAQDATGGTTGAKSCQHVSCPSFTEVDVAMIYKCLAFGNLGARAWPEQVTQFEGLASAAFAQLAERKLLDGISAASIHATGAAFGGAVATILGQIQTAAAGQRNRLRMDKDAQLQFMGPAWLRDAFEVDVVRSQFERFGLNDQSLAAWFSSINVTPTWYIDGTTAGGQVFGTQSAGALLPFPTTAQWFLFPPGSFLFLDAGVLDIGLVRDSTLNLTNDFQMFNEGFENVAFVGVESLQVISTFCANGQVIAPITAPSCAA